MTDAAVVYEAGMSRHAIHLSLPDRVALVPGGHLVLLSDDPLACIGLRRLGLEVRDTLLILEAGRQRLGFLARRPTDGTVAENVLRHGTGGLWIDGCRIQTTDSLTNHSRSAEAAVSKGKYGSSKQQPTHQTLGQTLGRWPTNLVLIHGSACRRTGTKKVRAITGTLNGSWRKGHQYNGGYAGADASELGRPIGYGDEEGNECVEAWACQEDCPVAAIDRQSGSLHDRGNNTNSTTRTSIWGQGTYECGGVYTYGDSGGASRFFPQFANEAEFMDWLNRLLGGPEDAQ